MRARVFARVIGLKRGCVAHRLSKAAMRDYEARVRELEKEGLRKEGAGAKKRSHEECEKPTWQQSLLGWTGMF